MELNVETCLVVALAFAVFAAVSAIGSSLVLGIGFERLRASFEVVKKQSGYFSDAIFRLDHRVDMLEKVGEASVSADTGVSPEIQHIVAEIEDGPAPKARKKRSSKQPAATLWAAGDENSIRFH
jgi:hypothetical protein